MAPSPLRKSISTPTTLLVSREERRWEEAAETREKTDSSSSVVGRPDVQEGKTCDIGNHEYLGTYLEFMSTLALTKSYRRDRSLVTRTLCANPKPRQRPLYGTNTHQHIVGQYANDCCCCC